MDRVSNRDREQWVLVLSAVKRAARRLPKAGAPPEVPRLAHRGDVPVGGVARPVPQLGVSSACGRSHDGGVFRPRKLPSVSQFTRRIRSERCRRILQWVHEELAAAHLATPVSYFDGKPLLVSPVSKDRDAGRGRVSGGWGKGYKLHAWGTEDGRIPLFCLTPLHAGECPVAEPLAWLLPPLPPGAVVLADTNFDDRDLHKPVNAKGGALVSPLKGQKEHPPEAGRHPVTLRQMGPGRRELLEAWAQNPDLVWHVLKGRVRIENTFSRVTFAGLGHLPPFVRGIGRVTRWAGAKLILYHALLRAKGPAPLPPAWG